MTISTSVATVALRGGNGYTPISLDIQVDNDRTPEWSGNIVMPFTSGDGAVDWTQLDARATPYPTVTVRWTFDGATVLEAFLLVRAVVVDDLAGTVTLSVRSGEVLLQDYRNTTVPTGDYSPGILTQKAMWQFAMSKLTPSGLVSDGDLMTSPSINIPAAATAWKNGQDLDSWLRGALRPSNLDVVQWMPGSVRTGKMILQTADLTNPTKDGYIGEVSAAYGVNLLTSRWGTTVEAGDGVEWAEAVVADYNWTTSAGVTNRKSYAKYALAAHRKGVHLSFDTGDAGFDPAGSLLQVAQNGGRTAQIAIAPTPAVIGSDQYPLGPGASVLITRPPSVPGPKQWRATLNRVQWSWPADRIELGVKNLSPLT